MRPRPDRRRDRRRALASRVPLRVLVPLGLVLLLVWGVVGLAGLVLAGSTRAVDEQLLFAMRAADPADPVGPLWFEEMARDITALGSNAVLGLLVAAVAGYVALVGRLRTAALLVASISVGLLLLYALKLGFDRPRPELVPHGAVVYTSSFPSGHSMASSLTFLTLAAFLARSQRRRVTRLYVIVVALIISGLVGLSRVYLGVHYPTDVVGGWALGAAWAVLTWLVADTLARRGTPDPPTTLPADDDF